MDNGKGETFHKWKMHKNFSVLSVITWACWIYDSVLHSFEVWSIEPSLEDLHNTEQCNSFWVWEGSHSEGLFFPLHITDIEYGTRYSPCYLFYCMGCPKWQGKASEHSLHVSWENTYHSPCYIPKLWVPLHLHARQETNSRMGGCLSEGRSGGTMVYSTGVSIVGNL